MYADDLLIMSPSVIGLQNLLDICTDYGNKYHILFNAQKTCCIAVGKNYSKCSSLPDMYIGDKYVTWAANFKYLGIVFVASKTLDVD